MTPSGRSSGIWRCNAATSMVILAPASLRHLASIYQRRIPHLMNSMHRLQQKSHRNRGSSGCW